MYTFGSLSHFSASKLQAGLCRSYPNTQDASKFVYIDLRCERRVPQYRLTTSHSSAMLTLTPNTSRMLVNVPPNALDRPDTDELLI
jgi:hypothetical protein